MSLAHLADFIGQEWTNVYFGAVPYLSAMTQLDSGFSLAFPLGGAGAPLGCQSYEGRGRQGFVFWYNTRSERQRIQTQRAPILHLSRVGKGI